MASTIEQRPSGRSFLPDAFKAAGCVLIVLHHLAFYGPMSDVVMRAWPALIEWLYDHGRLAVQVFLVCSGFLMAAALTPPQILGWSQAMQMAGRRYMRLVIPLLAALSLTVLLSEYLRTDHELAHLSATPDWHSALAHLLLLQHVVGIEALSAGIWYVAIDFQIYLITLMTMLVASKMVLRYPGLNLEALRWQLWLSLTVVSLMVWNLNDNLDDYGVYFLGSYGLGLLAYGARQSRTLLMAWGLLAALGLWVLWVDPRWRIAIAWGCALMLAGAPNQWFSGEMASLRIRHAIQWLSKVSYSVFLIHYPVSLLVSALVTAYWPEDILVNAMGMAASALMSVWAGSGLYRLTEHQPRDIRHLIMWSLIFMASVALAMKWS